MAQSHFIGGSRARAEDQVSGGHKNTLARRYSPRIGFPQTKNQTLPKKVKVKRVVGFSLLNMNAKLPYHACQAALTDMTKTRNQVIRTDLCNAWPVPKMP